MRRDIGDREVLAAGFGGVAIPGYKGIGLGNTCAVDVSRTIKCALLGDALVLGSMLEEHGAQVRRPDEDAPLTMVATGTLDGIRAAVAQLRHELVGSGLVVIEGEDAEAMLPETGPAAREVSPGSAERAAGAQAEAVGRGPATVG
jgi:hypothetical protein